jgi:hypothetical protein
MPAARASLELWALEDMRDDAIRHLSAALDEDGYVVVRVPQSLAESIRACIPTISSSLERVFASRVGDEIAGRCISMRAHSARSQLRVVDAPSDGDLVSSVEASSDRAREELEAAAQATKAALARVAQAALGAISSQRRIDMRDMHDAHSCILDCFYCPGSGGWEALGRDGPPPPPCPSHEDPGLMTVVTADQPGLEVACRRGGGWLRPVLRDDEVILLANRGLAALSGHALQACTHRVANDLPAPRTSCVYEIRLNEAGARAEADVKKLQCQRSGGGASGEAFERAAHALLGGPMPPRREAGCCLM